MDRIDPQHIFASGTPVVGMVHLLPLPGSPGWEGSMDAVLERALADARHLEEGGLDGLLVENFGDSPFLADRVPPETVAAMTRITATVVETVGLPVGVNVLRNAARAGLGVAVAAGARFIRVNVHTGVMFTDQGMLEGRAHETVRARRALEAPVAILADVLVKHATPPAGTRPEDAARDLWHRGRADALVVSGTGTGRPANPSRLRRVKDAVPAAPLWIGSGLTPETAGELLPLCDGVIVGSALQRGGQAGAGVEADRVGELMAVAARVR